MHKALIFCLGGVFGALCTLAILVVGGFRPESTSSMVGVALPPESLYDENGILNVTRDKSLVNYELSSPFSQLDVVESGRDILASDGKTDTWIVSTHCSAALPKNDNELGMSAIYKDENADGIPDKLSLLVGTVGYEFNLRLEEHVNDTGAHLSRKIGIYREEETLVQYSDWNSDALFDLISETEGLDLSAESQEDLNRNRWVVWDFKMYAVLSQPERDQKRYEIKMESGEPKWVEWRDDGWQLVAEE